MPNNPDVQLANSKGTAKSVPDEIKNQQEMPVGSIVDPAEVVPPIVPAHRVQRFWIKPLVITLIALIIIVVILVGF